MECFSLGLSPISISRTIRCLQFISLCPRRPITPSLALKHSKKDTTKSILPYYQHHVNNYFFNHKVVYQNTIPLSITIFYRLPKSILPKYHTHVNSYIQSAFRPPNQPRSHSYPVLRQDENPLKTLQLYTTQRRPNDDPTTDPTYPLEALER